MYGIIRHFLFTQSFHNNNYDYIDNDIPKLINHLSGCFYGIFRYFSLLLVNSFTMIIESNNNDNNNNNNNNNHDNNNNIIMRKLYDNKK